MSNAILKVFPFVAFFYVNIVQVSYRQHRFQAFGTLAALGGVGFVYDNGKAFCFQRLDLIHNHREFLQRGDDNGLAIFKRILELTRSFIDILDHAQGLLELLHRLLKLPVKHATVCNHDDRVKDTPILVIMQY